MILQRRLDQSFGAVLTRDRRPLTKLPSLHAVAETSEVQHRAPHLDVHQTGGLPVIKNQQRLADVRVAAAQLDHGLPHLAVRHRQRREIPARRAAYEDWTATKTRFGNTLKQCRSRACAG